MTTSDTSNNNGKRPHRDMQSSPRSGKHVHKSSGYKWDKAEHEPGYAWKGKKNVEEYNKAMEQVIDKHRVVGSMQPTSIVMSPRGPNSCSFAQQLTDHITEKYDLPIGEGDQSDKYE